MRLLAGAFTAGEGSIRTQASHLTAERLSRCASEIGQHALQPPNPKQLSFE